jgi:hypothetical protein
MSSPATLKAPFPWFGGKSRVADVVWERFGDVPNYVEPFAGSLAVLLGRPTAPRIETVNDLDAYLANFWRAVQADPEAVAHYADWPVNEVDLKARHLWLVEKGRPLVDLCREDPEYYDARIAGWWVWGLSMWIGGEWCTDQRAKQRKLPDLAPGKGVHRRAVYNQVPNAHPMGVHSKRPQLCRGGRGVHRHGLSDLELYMLDLCDRLRRVRVCCGDWTRVLKPCGTTQVGRTGVLLDPPYSRETGRNMTTYNVEDGDVAHAVRAWAIAHGNDPMFRIALCGYDGEHNELEDLGWDVYAWESVGGYASFGNTGRKDNRKRERIWFSPHCLRLRPGLFDGLMAGGA